MFCVLFLKKLKNPKGLSTNGILWVHKTMTNDNTQGLLTEKGQSKLIDWPKPLT